MDYEHIRLSIEPPLARVTLARPDAANRVGVRMLRELAEAFEVIANDSRVRAVVLAGEGRDFCAGWDEDTYAEGFDLPPDAFRFVGDAPQPVVCALHGRTAAAGLELALCADIRVGDETVRMALPETAEGGLPRAGGGQRVARLAGRGIALAMVLAGEELDATAALRAGLVSRITEAGGADAEAEAVARVICERGPLATRYAKEAMRRGLDMTLDQALRYETDLTIILQTTDDRAEGVRAFLEKRKPHFKGT
jgi:enoyl-CoA hydratase/carnithine racemase